MPTPNLTSMARKTLVALLLVAAVPLGGARASEPACSEPFAPATGVVATATCESEELGGAAPFSYYVPPACSEQARCPVLYLLHGLDGDHRSMLGTADEPSMFVRALSDDPLTQADEEDLAIILVAPHGRTVSTAPGAPAPGLESFWVDWNPRYSANPPRFEGFVTRELVALVDASLPTIAARKGRAIDGVSLGGFGSFKLAFQHPDLYVGTGSISGALNILVAPGAQPAPAAVPGTGGLPTEGPYTPAPGIARTPPGFPFGDPFGAFGDPAADEAYFRGNNPLDLALNAEGLGLRFFHNDVVSRDPARDAADPAGLIGSQALEAVVFPMNIEMVAALSQHGYAFTHEIHPGLHSGRYWDPYVRGQLEWHRARFAAAPAAPVSFAFRSIRREFSVWGWDVRVEDREATEFLTLRDVSRDGFTITGSGTVTVTTPPLPGRTGIEWSGIDGLAVERLGDESVVLRITLPPGIPTDEHAGSSGALPTARTARIGFVYG